MSDRVAVLDHGYVRLVDVMGDDLDVVNSARCSFDKESHWVFEPTSEARNTPAGVYHGGVTKTLSAKDQRLVSYLAEHNHWSPFSHQFLKFEVRAPLMVARQWFKHKVGCVYSEEGDVVEVTNELPPDSNEAWSESSRRYVTEEPEFYIPEVWRSAPENKKQGSGAPVSESTQRYLNELYQEYIHDPDPEVMSLYENAMYWDVCPEQARLFLPAYALYIRFRWTASLYRVITFLKLRQDGHAQQEIQAYADAVRQLSQPHFPVSFEAWGLG